MIKVIPVIAVKNAFDTLNNLFSSFFSNLDGSIKSIGLGASSLIFGITGVVLIFIAIICVWQIRKNNGVSEVWEEHSTKIIWIIGICAASALISLGFFGA